MLAVRALIPAAHAQVQPAPPVNWQFTPLIENVLAPPRWFVGTSGPYAGWLLMKGHDRGGAEGFIGQPWSTCALWRLGRELQALNAPTAAPQAGASKACEAPPSR